MAAESSKALIRRSTDTQLMPPPPKRIKRPQKVLEEDDYTSAISEIIARDFFPGLLESETQQEYLDALDSKDEAWISSSSRRLHQVMTPGRRSRRGTSFQTTRASSETPKNGYVSDTPMSVMPDTPGTATVHPEKEAIDTNMSLSAFQTKYTSEDNESFYKLLDKQNQKKAEKYAWMWTGNKLPSKMMIKQKDTETKLLMSGRSIIDDGGKRDRLAIQAKDEKPAMPDSWKSKADNNLMFRPEGVEDSIQSVAQKAQEESRSAPKGVVYKNTRMPLPETNGVDIPPSPSLSAIKDAIAGKPRGMSESGFGGSETPRVNGYAFVDDEPEDEYVPPPMQIELPKADATPNPFKMQERSGREDLHHRMVDRNSSVKRASSTLGMTGRVEKTPVPRFPSSPRIGAGNLTPAGQRLWSKVGRAARPGSPVLTGVRTPTVTKSTKSGLRVGWTPK